MSRVVVARTGDRSIANLDKAAYRALVEVGLCRLAAADSAVEAVRKLVPAGAVGLKTNCLTGKTGATSPALVEALGDVLEAAGRPANDIVVWERTNRELENAGYRLNASSYGRRCLGTDTRGVGYGADLESCGEVHSLVSRVLLDVVTSNINLPVLKDHSIVGLSGAMKNLFGAINNPNKYHGNHGDPFVAQVSLLPGIRQREVLTVVDAARVQYHLGPAFSASCLSPYGGIILSVDPVAADSVGLVLLEHLREKNGLPSLTEAGRPASYLKTAEQLGIGVADMSRIDLRVFDVATSGGVSEGQLLW